jgi:hypothetical protein
LSSSSSSTLVTVFGSFYETGTFFTSSLTGSAFFGSGFFTSSFLGSGFFTSSLTGSAFFGSGFFISSLTGSAFLISSFFTSSFFSGLAYFSRAYFFVSSKSFGFLRRNLIFSCSFPLCLDFRVSTRTNSISCLRLTNFAGAA